MSHWSASSPGMSLRRGDRGVGILGLLMSFALVAVIVVTGSRAAFTDTTANTGNLVAAGDVELIDDAVGVLFSVSNMAPGDSVTNCIAVTYAGSIVSPGQVRLYSGGYADSATLASYLNLTVVEGTGGTFGDCSGFSADSTLFTGTLDGFDTDHSNYATGAGSWAPAGTPETRSYRITLQLDAGTPNSQQGASVTDLAFVWEVST